MAEGRTATRIPLGRRQHPPMPEEGAAELAAWTSVDRKKIQQAQEKLTENDLSVSYLALASATWARVLVLLSGARPGPTKRQKAEVGGEVATRAKRFSFRAAPAPSHSGRKSFFA